MSTRDQRAGTSHPDSGEGRFVARVHHSCRTDKSGGVSWNKLRAGDKSSLRNIELSLRAEYSASEPCSGGKKSV